MSTGLRPQLKYRYCSIAVIIHLPGWSGMEPLFPSRKSRVKQFSLQTWQQRKQKKWCRSSCMLFCASVLKFSLTCVLTLCCLVFSFVFIQESVGVRTRTFLAPTSSYLKLKPRQPGRELVWCPLDPPSDNTRPFSAPTEPS